MINPTLQQETLTASLKQKSRSKWVADFAKSQILKRLQLLQKGCLTLIDGTEQHRFGNSDGVNVIVYVHDSRFYGEIAFGGSIGAAKLICWVIGQLIILPM